MLLGTSVRGTPCLGTGNGGNVMCQLEVAGEALARHHRTELASENWLCGQRRCCRSWCSDRARSVKWPRTFGSGG